MEQVEFISNNGQLNVIQGYNWETRGVSIEKLVREAYELSNKPDFNFVICTGDKPETLPNKKVFSFSTINDDYNLVVPDFNFDSWPQVGIDSYEEKIKSLMDIGIGDPSTNKLGWIGCETNHNRRKLFDIGQNSNNKEFYDFKLMSWNRQNPNKLYEHTTTYKSLEEQVKDWRYLIDLEGNGYSGRLKLFLFTNRLVFVQDRPYKEFWFKDFKPWVHYVPVKRDLSDLDDVFNKIQSNPELETIIKNNARKFALEHLTKQVAIDFYVNLLNSF